MALDSFIWTGTLGEEVVLTLNKPIQFREPDHFEDRYPEESLDGTVIEVVSAGTVLMEQVLGVIREPASHTLEELRRVAMNGLAITLTELADPARVFTVTAVPGSVSRVEREAQAGSLGYFTFGMTVRRLDGGLFV